MKIPTVGLQLEEHLPMVGGLMAVRKTIQMLIAGTKEVGQMSNHRRMTKLKEGGQVMMDHLTKEEQAHGMLRIKMLLDGLMYQLKVHLQMYNSKMHGSHKITEQEAELGLLIHSNKTIMGKVDG